MGCVLQAGAGMNVARQAALKAGLPVEVPGETVNRVCGSGLQAVVHAVEAIRVGYVDTIVAGGTESMSNAPYLLKGARWGYRMGHAEAIDSMLAEGLTCAINACHMGITAEEVAGRATTSRAPTRTHSPPRASARAADAIADRPLQGRDRAGRRFRSRRATRCRFDTDEYPARGHDGRRSSPRLKPAFKQDGSVDGWERVRHQRRRRGAVVVTTAEKAGRDGAPPLARDRVVCVRPASIPGSWESGRSRRCRKALERAGLTIDAHRSVRAERSLRRAVAGRRPRARRSTRRK